MLRGRPRTHPITMKKLIAATAIAALTSATGVPAEAQSKWIYIGSNDAGTRSWIWKHDWQGRFRYFSQKLIGSDRVERTLSQIADCRDWEYRFSNESQWHAVLQETLGDSMLRYVCK